MKGLEAENGVIGSILIDGSCLARVEQLLTGEDFALAANRKIFEAAQALAQEGKPVDPITLVGAVGNSCAKYMLELVEITPTSANAELYAEQTRRASMRRSLEQLGEELSRARAAQEDPREQLAQARKRLEQIEAMDTQRELADGAQAVQAFYEHRARVDQGAGGCVPTGYRRLDELLGGGLLNSGFYVLAARPGVGKTTFALAVAEKVAQRGEGVLFVTLEMDPEQLTAKRLAARTGLSAAELLMDKLGPEQYKKTAQAAQELARVPISLNRKSRAGVEDVRSMARKTAGLRLVVIDYFGLLHTSGRDGSRYEAMTQVSGQLKLLARELKCPVLCLAQLNRQNMGRKDPTPVLSDLRDTGALEQDADGVLFLHREDYYQAQEERQEGAPVSLNVLVAKNRHGRTGKAEMAFYMRTGRIVPWKY